MPRIALFPGTFDPVTVGHMALVRRAAAEFDEVVVCILIHPDKTPRFDEPTRLAMLRAATKSLPNVRVMSDHGMTADLAKTLGAVIIRGVRNEADAAYEAEMASFNQTRAGVETRFYAAPDALAQISSTRVRDALAHGESVVGLVPDEILPFLS